MQTFSQTFTAGSINRFDIPGEFFRLLTGTALRVEFFKGGASLGYADAVNAGFYDRKPEGFDSVSITDATGQAVKFAISNDEIGSADAVSVSGTVATTINGATPTQNEGVSVGTASTLLLAANAARRMLAIQNNDASNAIYISFDGTAATTAGWKIPAGGTVLFDNAAPITAIYGIAGTATTDVVVIEG